MYKVSFLINDEINRFTGKVSSIHLGDITFVSRLFDDVPFKIDHKNKTLTIEGNKICFIDQNTCPATWCADDFTFDFFNLKKLLNYIKNSKSFYADDMLCSVEHLFEKKTLLTNKDLEKIIDELELKKQKEK